MSLGPFYNFIFVNRFQVYLIIAAAPYIVDMEKGRAAGKNKTNKKGENNKKLL